MSSFWKKECVFVAQTLQILFVVTMSTSLKGSSWMVSLGLNSWWRSTILERFGLDTRAWSERIHLMMWSITWQLIWIRHNCRWRKVGVIWLKNSLLVSYRFFLFPQYQIWVGWLILLKRTLWNPRKSYHRSSRFIIPNKIKAFRDLNILPFQSFHSILQKAIILLESYQFLIDFLYVLRVIKVNGLELRVITRWVNLHWFIDLQTEWDSPRWTLRILLFKYWAFKHINLFPKSNILLLYTIQFVIFVIKWPCLHINLLPEALIGT